MRERVKERERDERTNQQDGSVLVSGGSARTRSRQLGLEGALVPLCRSQPRPQHLLSFLCFIHFSIFSDFVSYGVSGLGSRV